MPRFSDLLREHADHLDRDESVLAKRINTQPADDEKLAGIVGLAVRNRKETIKTGTYLSFMEAHLRDVGWIFRPDLPGEGETVDYARFYAAYYYSCLEIAAAALDAAIKNAMATINVDRRTAAETFVRMLQENSVREGEDLITPQRVLRDIDSLIRSTGFTAEKGGTP